MLNRKIFSLFACVVLCGIFSACNSTKQEPEKSKTTFVNTKALADDSIYSIIVFSRLISVKAEHLRTKQSFDIPLENCEYDSETTLLEITLPPEIHCNIRDLAFTITGEPLFPAEFVLCGANYRSAMPGIFYNGKAASEGVDYKLNSKTNRLSFIVPLDADKGSYDLLWLSRTGTNSLSNNTDKYKSQYSLLERRWYKNIGNSR